MWKGTVNNETFLKILLMIKQPDDVKIEKVE